MGEIGVVAWAAIGCALVAWVVLLVLAKLSGLLPFLVTAGLVAMILTPLVNLLMRLHLPRPVAATVAFLIGVAATPALVTVVVQALVSQVRSLLESSPQSLQQGGIVGHLVRSSNPLLHNAGTAITSWVADHQADAGPALATLTVILARAGVVLMLGLLLGYLFLLTRPSFGQALLVLVPPSRRVAAQEILGEMGRIVGGYVRARFIVSAVVGTLATIGLWAIHMPFWLVLGLFVGVANLIPTIGTYIGAAPVVLVSLLTKPPAFLLAALAVITMSHVVDGFILSPLVLKETTDLHPVVVLLAVIVGAELAGLWGVLAAIPVAGIVQFLLRRFVRPKFYGPEPVAPVPVSAADLPPEPT